MPLAPLRPCPSPGCPELTDGGPCAAHARARDQQRGTAHQRGYGATWRHLRLAVLREEPVCRICRRRSSSEVDHIVPRAAGGSDERSNLQGLCKRCHSKKTAEQDGRWGARA